MPKNKFIPVARPDLTGNELSYLTTCITTSWISSAGEFIDRFEKSFADYIGTKYAVSSSNGTVALHLALLALGIGKGDEVIVPDLTFIASANAVTYTGAKPVLVDVDKMTWNVDPAVIVRKITSRTKAIMVVHLYGNPADMNVIMILAKRYNLYVIEDAAEAHGADMFMQNKKWIKVGSIGDVGCFSFYGNKIITTGEGGMIVTDDHQLAEKMRILRDHGQEPGRRYYHKIIGFNYRMTNLQAAIGLAQLERINKFVEKKRTIAKIYNKMFACIPGITLPPESDWAHNVYWMYSIIVNTPYPLSRDMLILALKNENIETRPFFYPLHELPPYKMINDFPNSSYLSKHGINLPSSVTLTIGDINRIATIIKHFA